MASYRMTLDTVTLFNHVGEQGGSAQFQVTILRRVHCPTRLGASIDSSKLYVFDENVIAESLDGVARQYASPDEWNNLPDKGRHWTIKDNGNDYFAVGVHQMPSPLLVKKPFRITKVIVNKLGTRRMWHLEVNGA